MKVKIKEINDEGILFFVDAPRNSEVWKAAIKAYAEGKDYDL